MEINEIKRILHQFVLLNSIENDTNTNELNRLHLNSHDISKMIEMEIKENTIVFIKDNLTLTNKGKVVLKKNEIVLNNYFKIDSNFSNPLYSYLKLSNEDNELFIPDEGDF